MKKNLFLYVLTLLFLFVIPSQVYADDYFKRGDTNGDSIVSITDVTTLIGFLLSGQWPDGQNTTPPAEIKPFVVNNIPFKMIYVEGGRFVMGNATDYSNSSTPAASEIRLYEQPAHQVQVSSFYIGETEVTQELWLAVMGENPSKFTAANGYYDNLTRPVENISWDDCQEFIAKLNEMTGLNFRLPTDAEWEFAALGGTKSMGFTYSGSNTANDVAWYSGNNGAYNSFEYGTKAVATKAPNELGIYDMSGNVAEWCQDWYAKYSGTAQVDPTGPDTGTNKVSRNGSCGADAFYIRVTRRIGQNPTVKNGYLGLRLAL